MRTLRFSSSGGATLAMRIQRWFNAFAMSNFGDVCPRMFRRTGKAAIRPTLFKIGNAASDWKWRG
jgi:hypothetical protein